MHIQNQLQQVADDYNELREAVLRKPAVPDLLTDPNFYAGTGADFVTARAFTQYRDSLVKIVKEQDDRNR